MGGRRAILEEGRQQFAYKLWGRGRKQETRSIYVIIEISCFQSVVKVPPISLLRTGSRRPKEEDGEEPPGPDGSCGDTEKGSRNWEWGGVQNREGKRGRVWLLPKPL